MVLKETFDKKKKVLKETKSHEIDNQRILPNPLKAKANLICKNPHGEEINRDLDLISKKVRNNQSLLRNQVTVI